MRFRNLAALLTGMLLLTGGCGDECKEGDIALLPGQVLYRLTEGSQITFGDGPAEGLDGFLVVSKSAYRIPHTIFSLRIDALRFTSSSCIVKGSSDQLGAIDAGAQAWGSVYMRARVLINGKDVELTGGGHLDSYSSRYPPDLPVLEISGGGYVLQIEAVFEKGC